RSADARPHDAVARRGGSTGTVDEPAVRLVAGRDAVARVHIRAASKETHGLFAGALAEDDRPRAALADGPGARAGRRRAASALASRRRALPRSSPTAMTFARSGS